MGFGHRVYKTVDPRAVILKDAREQLSARQPDEPKWYDDVERRSRHVVLEREGPLPERRLLLGVDVYHYAGHPDRPVHADLRDEPRRRAGPRT